MQTQTRIINKLGKIILETKERWGSNMKAINDQSLVDSELRYRRLFEAAQDGILILDAETGAIKDVNPFLEKLLGYTEDEFISKKLWEVGAFKDIKASKNAFLALQKNEYIRYKDLPLRAKNGQLIQVEFVSNVYKEGHEKVIQCNIRDISERKQVQDALRKNEAILREQSVRDSLTGLFNRRYLEETLRREINRAARKNYTLGVIMLDIDYFKTINDTYGHHVGDLVLCDFSNVISRNIREEDIACRYGGDEFIIVLPDTSLQVTCERAEQLLSLTGQMQVQFEDCTISELSTSIGISFYPDNGKTKGDILKTADMALYSAKNNGRGCLVISDRLT
jgi:diguanylate cyclase (GGDEF)-like protein/PAS domain S-box-containing protein